MKFSFHTARADSAILYHQRKARKSKADQEAELRALKQATLAVAEPWSLHTDDKAIAMEEDEVILNPLLEDEAHEDGHQVTSNSSKALGEVDVDAANAARYHDASLHDDHYHQLVSAAVGQTTE